MPIAQPVLKPASLLGGISPAQFMRRHWQKKPLLVRGAVAGMQPLLSRAQLFEFASRDAVESRLVIQDGARWRVKQGPFARRSLPPLSQSRWSLLVQGVDLHDDGAHELLQRFAFVPQARMDDLMISWASDGGGVGPHFDSYDVFLLQAHGRRKWRIGRQKDLSLRDGVPLKMLAKFEPEEEHVLGPGDMLYLPPRWAHEGIALGECQTCSIGFRAPSRDELARELLQRIADDASALAGDARYRDAAQEATCHPGELPRELREFAEAAVRASLGKAQALERALGEFLTEPKPNVWFDAAAGAASGGGVRLDRRTRMMYDARHVFINGDSLRASGRDAKVMRELADTRTLSPARLADASTAVREVLASWIEAGWAHATQEPTHGP